MQVQYVYHCCLCLIFDQIIFLLNIFAVIQIIVCKGAPYPEMDQKVCLNLVKLDQLCAIALMKREEILRILLKMVAMATSHSLWRLYLIALTPTTPALLQNKI